MFIAVDLYCLDYLLFHHLPMRNLVIGNSGFFFLCSYGNHHMIYDDSICLSALLSEIKRTHDLR